MSFITMSPKPPLNPAFVKAKAVAKETKSSVLETVKKFQDAGQNNDANLSFVPDLVLMTSADPGIFPPSCTKVGNGQVQAKSEDPKLATGFSQTDTRGLLQKSDIEVVQGDKTQEFYYERKLDGTQIYSAPFGDGDAYVTVHENTRKGTLFVEMEDQGNSWTFPNSSSPNSPDTDVPRFATLADSLKAISNSA